MPAKKQKQSVLVFMSKKGGFFLIDKNLLNQIPTFYVKKGKKKKI